MSAPEMDIDEGLYELYLQDCRALEIKPSVRDFIVWKQSEYPELDETTQDWEHEQ